MKRWLTWPNAVRALGVATMILGAIWHEGTLVLGGLGVAAGPTVLGGRDSG